MEWCVDETVEMVDYRSMLLRWDELANKQETEKPKGSGSPDVDRKCF